MKKESVIRKFSIKRQHFAFPYFFLSALFVVVPLIILLVYAFRDASGAFTLGNFAAFFSENILMQMRNSLMIAAFTTIGCLLLAYPTALILANSKFNKTMILVLMFILPMYINSMLRTYAIKSLFDMIELHDSFIRIVIAHIYDFFPFMLLPIYTVLVNMDKSYLEASNDLGGSAVSTFLRITLPLSLPGIISGVLMVFMPTVSMFAIRDIVVEGTGWRVIGNAIGSMFGDQSTYGFGAAYAMILLVMVVVTMLIANRMNRSRNLSGGAK